jgi:hypothetical protein
MGPRRRAPLPGRARVGSGAPRAAETVFFHTATRSLVCTDFLFHVTRPENLRTRFVLALMGEGGGRLAASRAWRFLVKDRAAAARAVVQILEWPIERIVMAHGEIVERDGRAALDGARLDRIRGRAALAPAA